MLFRAVETYLLNHITPRTMPHLKQYIETLNTQRELYSQRNAVSPGYESNLAVLLRKILADADVPTLLAKKSDIDRYFDILVFTVPGLNGIFDTVTTGLSFYDIAIRRSAVRTEEFYIPVACEDVVASLPLDQGWDAWKTIKPLRLVDIDSQELTFNTYQDQIVFTSLHPTRAVFTIDVAALVLQYVAYLSSHDQAITQAEYLHQWVIGYLLQDLQDLWLSNIYQTMLQTSVWTLTKTKDYVTQITTDTRYGYHGTELPSALKELATMILACSNGSVTPSVLVQSLLLSNGSVPDFIRQLITTTSVEDHRQNIWMEYLKDSRWLNILLYAYILQPNFIATRNLFTNLKRDIPILCAQKVWHNCRSAQTSQMIQTGLTDLLLKVT